MKVKDMIELLKQVNPEMQILVYDPDAHGYEPGNDLSIFKAKIDGRPYYILDEHGQNCVEICHDPEK